MEGSFDSAKNQFKTNYIQYFLTQEDQYKTAYTGAQKIMDSILDKDPGAPPVIPKQMKSTHERSFATLKRTSDSPTSIPNQTWKYWTLGSLLVVSIGLSMI